MCSLEAEADESKASDETRVEELIDPPPEVIPKLAEAMARAPSKAEPKRRVEGGGARSRVPSRGPSGKWRRARAGSASNLRQHADEGDEEPADERYHRKRIPSYCDRVLSLAAPGCRAERTGHGCSEVSLTYHCPSHMPAPSCCVYISPRVSHRLTFADSRILDGSRITRRSGRALW
mgnify:FL=1